MPLIYIIAPRQLEKERGYSLKSVIVHQIVNRRGGLCMLLCKNSTLMFLLDNAG